MYSSFEKMSCKVLFRAAVVPTPLIYGRTYVQEMEGKRREVLVGAPGEES